MCMHACTYVHVALFQWVAMTTTAAERQGKVIWLSRRCSGRHVNFLYRNVLLRCATELNQTIVHHNKMNLKPSSPNTTSNHSSPRNFVVENWIICTGRLVNTSIPLSLSLLLCQSSRMQHWRWRCVLTHTTDVQCTRDQPLSHSASGVM